MTDVNVNELMAEHQKMLDEYNAAREVFAKKGKEIIRTSFKAFFDANPKIKAVTWTQYTPHFNDGEPCVFRVGDMWALSEKGLEDWEENGCGHAEDYAATSDWGSYDKELLNEDEAKAVQTFLKSIHKLPDDIFEDMFGDHVYVVATEKGFDVEEYEHD
jgi:hypothetical protein